MSISSDLIGVFINRVILLIIIFATDILISRYLGPEAKGYYVVLTLTPAILAVAANIGLEFGLNAVSRTQALGRDKLFRLFSSALLICLGLCAIIFVLLHYNVWYLTDWLYKGVSAQAGLWVALSLLIMPMEVLFFMTAMLVIILGRPLLFSNLRLIRRGTVLIGAILIYFLVQKDIIFIITAFLIIQIGAIGSSALVGMVLVGYRIQRPIIQIQRLLYESFRVYPSRLADHLQSRLNLILLGMLASTYAVGIYSVALGIVELLFILSTEVGWVFFSRDVIEKAEMYQRGVRLLGAVLLVTAILTGLAATLMVPLLYGARFGDSVYLIWLLLPGAFFYSLMFILQPYFVQGSQAGVLSFARVMGLLINLSLTWLWAPTYGAVGAAYASSVASCLTALFLMQRFRKACSLSWLQITVPTREDMQLCSGGIKSFCAKYSLVQFIKK